MQKLTQRRDPPASGPPASDPRSGGSLIMVMVIVIAFSLIGVALLQTADLNGMEMARGQKATEAFWLAEGGLHHAAARLRTDTSYRSNPTTFSIDLGGGRYTVSATSEGASYALTSRARVGNAYRTLLQSVTVSSTNWPNPGAALVSGGDIELKGTNNTVTGDIIAGGDILITGKVVRVYGDIIADGDVRLTPGGIVASGTVQVTDGNTVYPSTLPQSPPPDPLPTLTDWSDAKATYDAMIAIARTSTLTSVSWPLSLSNRTLYVRSNSIDNDVGKPLIGPGTLVVSGDVKLMAISNSVTVISGGKLQLGTGSAPNPFPIANSTFYSGDPTERMWLDCPYLSFSNCVVMSAENIETRSFTMLDANTVFLALGTVVLGVSDGAYNINIRGRIEAGISIVSSTKSSVNITHPTLPALPPGFEGSVTVTRTQWTDGGSDPF